MQPYWRNLLNPRSWSIRWRLTLWHAGLVGLVLSSMAIVAVVTLRSVLLASSDRSITIKAARAIDDMTGEGKVRGERIVRSKPYTMSQIVEFAQSAFRRQNLDVTGQTYYMELCSPSSAVPLASSSNIPPHGYVSRTLRHVLKNASLTRAELTFDRAGAGSELRVLSAPVQATGMIVLVATPWVQGAAVVAPVAVGLLLLVIIVTVITGLSGWFLIDRTLQPIDEIVTEAEKHRGGRLPPEFVASRALGDDEIGRLVNSLNAMMERVYWSIERQRQFTADASHDLRTPLTILRGEIQLTLARERTTREYQETLESMLEETDRLMRLVVDLGELARSDSATDHGVTKTGLVHVDQICREIVKNRQSEAARNQVTLAFVQDDAAGNALVLGRSVEIERAIANLVDNAIKYNRPRGEVSVGVRRTGDELVEVRVEDTGIGIPIEDHEYVFERFYRGDKARSGAATCGGSGSGLGLAIARSVIHAHGGRIDLESIPSSGSVFRVLLPAVEPGAK